MRGRVAMSVLDEKRNQKRERKKNEEKKNWGSSLTGLWELYGEKWR